ncbi:XAC2610-related protein [Flavobacterium quisquiliarum]|uniref:XAC2610-related protein n=1 Tax=Flavobacterium quisquiliarum TaxID=1834436 RepID=A0ABV8W4F4_9FLAO|nr:hypothetical protein [Flavobacterium quisquiliarum]MBW1658398.1 hypothetical protein [Flavobacterium quisquiliarum]
MKNIPLLIIFVFLANCNKSSEHNKTSSKVVMNQKEIKNQVKHKIIKAEESFTETETFIDSTRIAEKGKYKIEITQTTIDNNTNVSFKLFLKQNDKWKNIQKYSLPKESDIPLITEIEDFNNDGFNDFTIHYSTAGRGANDIRKLFIFSNKEHKFIEIKNSDLYPNLQYNEKLDCIDALSVYAGSSTTFLKLRKDHLVEFARVDFMDGKIEIYLIEKNKKRKLRSETYSGSNDEMIRFINYNPLEEYDYEVNSTQ